ncbi:HNH endonuclease [Desulfonema magnum]|uniref:HNH endonuclease n=1 Tax=Desulfonema magnum TaxID=45655 RepID=UPI0033902CEB
MPPPRGLAGACKPAATKHIIPVSKQGSDDESNLWLACPFCNRHKGNKTESSDPEAHQIVPLFNPRIQVWSQHFRWSEDGICIIGRTPTGRATVETLCLSSDPLKVRSYWVMAGWHPPDS